MSKMDEAEAALIAARSGFSSIMEQARLKQGPEFWTEYEAAKERVLGLERKVAALKGEPYAMPLEFPVQWDVGAPMPLLIADGLRAFVTFFVRVPDPNWDGTYVNVRDMANANCEPIALVEFGHCTAAKLGAPNDEVLHGHPLWNRGLEGYSAQIVLNSPWLAELQRINSVHRSYNQAHWTDEKHFVFWFHDETFECIARSFSVEVFEEPLSEVLGRITAKLVPTN